MLTRRSMLQSATGWATAIALAGATVPLTPALAAEPEPEMMKTATPAGSEPRAATPAKGEEKAAPAKSPERSKSGGREKAATSEKSAAPTVPLEFTEELDSRKVRKGDRVTLRVADDVTMDGKLRFRKGAEAQGIIERVKQPGRFGQKAQIQIRLEWAKDVDGKQVPLSTYSTGNRFDAGAGGASLGGAVLLGPIGLLGGALVKGGHITIKKGARIQAHLLERPERQ